MRHRCLVNVDSPQHETVTELGRSSRTQARAIKDDVLLHLDQYLEKFVANAESRGAQFHWARDAAEANSIICDLATERGARTIVKSKSMTTEETHLNVALEAARHPGCRNRPR